MRLHELDLKNKNVNLKHGMMHKYQWIGGKLWIGKEAVEVCDWVIYSDSWSVDEPTVEDVLKERGWTVLSINIGFAIRQFGYGSPELHLHKKPETVADITRIIDFLESLTPPKTGG